MTATKSNISPTLAVTDVSETGYVLQRQKYYMQENKHHCFPPTRAQNLSEIVTQPLEMRLASCLSVLL